MAKLKKVGPTPANAVGTDGVGNAKGTTRANVSQGEEEPVDKTPSVEDGDDDSDFGGWDSEEDRVYMERAQKNDLRRRGKNPKAVLGNNKKTAKQGQNGAQKSVEKKRAKARSL